MNQQTSPADEQPKMFVDQGRHATNKAGVYKPAATEGHVTQDGPTISGIPTEHHAPGGTGAKLPVENVQQPQLNPEEPHKKSIVEKELNAAAPKQGENVGTGSFTLGGSEKEVNASINAAPIGVNPPLNAPTSVQQRDISTEDNKSTKVDLGSHHKELVFEASGQNQKEMVTKASKEQPLDHMSTEDNKSIHLSLGSQKEELKNVVTDAINNDPSKNLPVQKVEQLDTTADFMNFEKKAEQLQKEGKTFEETKELVFEKSGQNQKEMLTKASKEQPLDPKLVPESEKKAPPHQQDAGRTLPERIEQAAVALEKDTKIHETHEIHAKPTA